MDAMMEMIREERHSLEHLHKRAIKDLEKEELVRSQFEHRRSKSLSDLIKDEEKRIENWRYQLSSDLDRKEQELSTFRQI